MSVIKIVVFDMDGVLCRYRIERRLARLASWCGQSPDAIHAAIWRSGFEDEAERGVMSADDYLRGFGERLGYPLSAAQWVEARRVAVEPDQPVLSLARQLSVDRPVGMFTNNPWLLKRHIGEVFPAVPALFGTRAVFSAELGRSKPDPEAFRRLAARLGVAPAEILYFDDDATYVAGAREAGLSAHCVGGAAGVRTGLAMHDLKDGMPNAAPPVVRPVVRSAVVADATAALACVVEAFEPYIERIGKAPTPMRLDYPTLIADGCVWVADVNSEVEGVLVQYETQDGFYVDTVAVSAGYRGLGVGRALLEFAEAEATRRGYTSVYLCTNFKMTENQMLYTKIGYVEYDRRTEAGYDRVFYRKTVA